ncbi:MAG: spore germination protein [Clostridia bacterium]|nr:spore germination protein [Clostridia bacterium]
MFNRIFRKVRDSIKYGTGINVSGGDEHQSQVDSRLDNNLQRLKGIFEGCADVVFREFSLGTEEPVRAALLFVEGLVEMVAINENIMKPLMYEAGHRNPAITNIFKLVKEKALTIGKVNETTNMEEVVEFILSGYAAIFIDGSQQVMLAHVRGGEHRAVEEPSSEVVVRGPREAFTETLHTNISLVRRRLKNPDLKVEMRKVGRRTKTDLAILYIKGIVNEKIIREVKERLNRVDVDGTVASRSLGEIIQDTSWTPFPLITYTERPDKLTAQLLEGRVAIMVDGTPIILTVPVLFMEQLQSSEDYYEGFFPASAIRLLRFMAINIALLLPSLYVAVTTFHQEMLPTPLLISLAGAREGVPFPAFVEALVMEITFEILREAGIRLPRPAGQAVSIVGALVIGDAAVSAGIVSPAMVIIVSLTGIASFTIPGYSFALALRLLRFPIMFLAATLGLFGIMMGLIFLLIHLVSLRSFGMPYMSPIAPATYGDWKDTFVRFPWWAMVTRPRLIGQKDPVRQARGLQPKPPDKDKGGSGNPGSR